MNRFITLVGPSLPDLVEKMNSPQYTLYDLVDVFKEQLVYVIFMEQQLEEVKKNRESIVTLTPFEIASIVDQVVTKHTAKEVKQ